MNFFGAYKKISVACGALAIVLFLSSVAHAATSTNFIISQDESGSTEGDAASANFLIKWKVGLPAAGQLNSGSYVVDIGGRWFEPAPVPPVVPTPTPPTPPALGPSPVVPVPIAVTTTPTSTTTTTPAPPTSSTTPAGTTTPNPPGGTGPTTTPPTIPPSTGSSTTPPSVQPPAISPSSSTTPPASSGGSTSTPPVSSGSSTTTSSTTDSVPTINNTLPSDIGLPIIKRTTSPVVVPVKKPGITRSWGAALRSQVDSLVKDSSTVKEVAQVLNPTLAALAVTTLALQVPAAGLLSLLQFLFLQPLLLFGYGRRAKAGQVYNALSKMPIDLALVRLIDTKTNRIIQSRVTDKNGFFYFQASPGAYRIEVTKEQMVFPSKLLVGRNVDGRKANIYHGEIIEVVENYPLITPNIPLDPIVIDKPFTRIIWETWARRLQTALAFSGVLIVLVTIIISSGSWYLYGLLLLHIMLFMIFRRLAVPPKPKGWGIVYDESDKKPLGRTIARLFNTEFNKLVATQITDPRGRYYFLAGDSKYQVRFERKDYETTTSKQLDLSGKDVETIDLEVPLKKTDSDQTSINAPHL